jgi:hypothetical protein
MAVNPHTGELYTGGCAGTWVLAPPYGASVAPRAGGGAGGRYAYPEVLVVGRGAVRAGVGRWPCFDLSGRRTLLGRHQQGLRVVVATRAESPLP